MTAIGRRGQPWTSSRAILAAMRLSKRAAEIAVAAAIMLVALAISPIGICFVSGRFDLPLRVSVVSLTFDAFLLILAVTIVARGRARQILFYPLACSLVLAAVAAVEAGAQAIRLSDRVAPLEDTSTLLHGDRWPPQLMSGGRFVEPDGLRLYRPLHGNGILINDLGLRTAPPTPKRPGEWRIALTGGSAAWGWRVLDADTIAVQLQQALHRQGHPSITVYNFGIEIAAMAEELALLRRFPDHYSIAQTVFYTGVNDAILHYLRAATLAAPAIGWRCACVRTDQGRPSPLRQISGAGRSLAGQNRQRGPAVAGARELVARRDRRRHRLLPHGCDAL